MKKHTIALSILFTLSSPMAYAAGDHMGGHGGDHSMMNHGAGHWMAPSREASKKNPVTASTKSIKQGSMLFQQFCTSCHGKTAEGDGMAGQALNPKPTNLRIMAGRHLDGDFAYKIKTGKGAMPSWRKTFNDTQVWNIVNYIQSLKDEPKSSESNHGQNKRHDHHS